MHLALFQAHLPFAVVGSTEEVKVGNKLVRARQYPWGVVQGKALQAGHPPQISLVRACAHAGTLSSSALPPAHVHEGAQC